MKINLFCSVMYFRLMVTALLTSSMLVGYTAHAVSDKECSQQFSVAVKDGSIKNQNFKDFKAAHCADKKDVADIKADVKKDEKKNEGKGDDIPKSNGSSKEGKSSSAVAVDTGDAVFPTAIDAKYVNEKEGNARMKTCLDQYKNNKASNKNGKLKWIQKGGGYYSECTKRLKEHKSN